MKPYSVPQSISTITLKHRLSPARMSRLDRDSHNPKPRQSRQAIPLWRPVGVAMVMGLFALAGAGGVMWVHQLTEERILLNQRQDALVAMHRLLPKNAYDNDLLAHPLRLVIPRNGRMPLAATAYLAMWGERPVATLVQLTTPDGYNGDIRLLLSVRANGTLDGVEVIEHRETPGLGDRIESGRSDWLRQFENASLEHPALADWRVKRDGGRFDQLTGATVTPRAVVAAVRDALGYLRIHPIEPGRLLSGSNSGRVADSGHQAPRPPAGI